MGSSRRYAPPASPPPKQLRPLLKPSTTLSYPIDLEKLSTQGWVSLPINYSESDPLYEAFSALFESSARFFDLPEEERMKYRVGARKETNTSEEGYSRVEGEKCLIALRKAQTTPMEFALRGRAEKAWRASAGVMRDVLQAIEESLGMSPGVLVRTSERQLELPGEGEGNVATLMRMFRYDRPPPPVSPGESTSAGGGTTSTASGSRVVSEPHRDLGLLTFVLGHSPGLECWDAERDEWVSCETNERGLNATILVGETLTKFTNGRFVAGRHRVFVHPSHPTNSSADSTLEPTSESQSQPQSRISPLTNPSFRYSLVHALRGHLPLLTSSQSFETPITGAFPPHLAWSDASIGEIYNAISRAHWNVNIGVEERQRQERELREKHKHPYTKAYDYDYNYSLLDAGAGESETSWKLAFVLTSTDPPSMTIWFPETYAEAGEHRNRARPAMSVGDPTRPAGGAHKIKEK
ncbi:hypothetical protein ACEPAI_1276 [Sanghuangporus weigelae]